MEIGIDDLDDYENESVIDKQEEITTETQDTEDTTVSDSSDSPEEEDFISLLLKTKGIQDSSKIKFETDNGEIEEVDWNTLSNEDKLNILTSNENIGNETDLDDSEIDLINSIRGSKMSPSEYIAYVQNQGVQNYLQNVQSQYTHYSVDDLDDDDIFRADIIARLGDENVTDEEVETLLQNAKSNETVFKKLIELIRNEYKQIEDYNTQQDLAVQQLARIENYNRFAESVEDEIRAFTDVYGYPLSMDEDEMEELYDFITGFDSAGTSIFGKALNDPKLLVQMAWFALNGEKAMQDIDDYWTKEITNVRLTSYNKGIEDYKNGKVQNRKSHVEIKRSNKKSTSSLDDLDNF